MSGALPAVPIRTDLPNFLIGSSRRSLAAATPVRQFQNPGHGYRSPTRNNCVNFRAGGRDFWNCGCSGFIPHHDGPAAGVTVPATWTTYR
jgi:hypothetical protein